GDGRGGSSALPHKRNPVDAVLIRGATMRAPGLVATVLAARGRGHGRAGHAVGGPRRGLRRLAAGAAARARALLDGLEVHPDRMRAALTVGGGLLLAERVAARLGEPPGPGGVELVRRLR